jgi:hypothetical protein
MILRDCHHKIKSKVCSLPPAHHFNKVVMLVGQKALLLIWKNEKKSTTLSQYTFTPFLCMKLLSAVEKEIGFCTGEVKVIKSFLI